MERLGRAWFFVFLYPSGLFFRLRGRKERPRQRYDDGSNLRRVQILGHFRAYGLGQKP